MRLTSRVGLSEIRLALATAETVGVTQLKGQLYAPTDAVAMGRVEEAWAFVKAGILKAYRQGQSEVDSISAGVWSSVQEVLGGAGGKLQTVEESLMERLRDYSVSLNQGLLRQVSSRLSIGDIQLILDTVEMQQELRVEGSLKASLTEILKISSNGSVELTASYKRG